MGEGGSGHKGPHVLCSLDFLLESVGEGGGSDIMGFLFWEDDFGFLCGKGGRQGRFYKELSHSQKAVELGFEPKSV